MIRLTRLNNRPLVVNSDLIKFIENAPDTVITLVSGEKIVVLESAQEVISRIVDFRRRLRRPFSAVLTSETPDEQSLKSQESEGQDSPEASPEEDE
jgi:flagellar protein FlbD